MNRLLRGGLTTGCGRSSTSLRCSLALQPRRYRWAHEEEKPNTKYLWVSNLHPVQRGWIWRRMFAWNQRFSKQKLPLMLDDIGERVGCPLRVVQYETYARDGGALVEVQSDDKNHIETAVEYLQGELKFSGYRAPFTYHTIQVFPVLGNPWINDLRSPFPVSYLQVQIPGKQIAEAASLQRELFRIFRPYGPLFSIERVSPEDLGPTNDNAPPTTYYQIRYQAVPYAVSARMCLHQANFYDILDRNRPEEDVPWAGEMQIHYLPFDTANIFKQAYQNHPRWVTFAMVVLLASMGYLVIQPLRRFFVWIRLVQDQSDELGPLPMLLTSHGKKQIELALHDRDAQVQKYLASDTDTILYITGPAGSGKSQMARRAMTQSRSRDALLLDFEDLLKLSDHEEMVTKLANKVGFHPTYRVTETAAAVLEGLSPGAKHATPAASNESKMQEILRVLTDVMRGMKGHRKPLIVIDGFSRVEEGHRDFVRSFLQYVDLWVECKIAHVIFVADSAFEASGGLSALMPHAKVERLLFTDLDEATSTELITRMTEANPLPAEDVQEAVALLGGRLKDLHGYINRVHAGLPSRDALRTILQSYREEVQGALFKRTACEEHTTRMWRLIGLLAKNQSLTYDYVLFFLFAGDNQALCEAIDTGLFSISYSQGRTVDTVIAGSPVLQKVFEELYDDQLLRPSMDLMLAQATKEEEEKILHSLEEELIAIHGAKLDKEDQLGPRYQFLLQQFLTVQSQIAEHQQQIEENRDLLKHLKCTH